MKRCTHFSQCSGCSHHLDATRPDIWERVTHFFGFPVPLLSENKTSWRTRAKLAIRRGSRGLPALGLFRRKSHDLVEIPSCVAHHPSINRAAALIQREMAHLLIEPYDEVRQTGSLRYAQFFVCRESNLVQLSLVSRERQPAERLIERLSKEPNLWHSIWINLHDLSSNAILGREWIHILGEPFLYQRIGRSRVAFHPASFSQAHLSLFDKLLEQIESWVPLSTRLLEIYAGAGAISLHLSPRLASAILVEENPYSHLSYQASHPPSTFVYRLGDAKEAIAYFDKADVILVDPPRKGLDADLLAALKQTESKQLIYISCSFDSFEKDANELMASGWKLLDVSGYWLFPGADHIELASRWQSP